METKQYTLRVDASLRDSVRHRALTFGPQIGLKVTVTEARKVDHSIFVFTAVGNDRQHIVFKRFLGGILANIEQKRTY